MTLFPGRQKWLRNHYQWHQLDTIFAIYALKSPTEFIKHWHVEYLVESLFFCFRVCLVSDIVLIQNCSGFGPKSINGLVYLFFFLLLFSDFGLSNSVRVSHTKDSSTVQEFCVTQCGSPAYAAPELLGNKKYGPEVDIWSVWVHFQELTIKLSSKTHLMSYCIIPASMFTIYACNDFWKDDALNRAEVIKWLP